MHRNILDQIRLTASPALLTQQGASGDWSIREAVAKNPNTPPLVLTQLAKDDVWWVQFAVAKNASTPPTALVRLSRSAQPLILEAVARHAHTPPAVLARLGRVHGLNSSVTRRHVAQHPATPLAVLARLENDPSPLVRRALVLRINEPVFLHVLQELGLDVREPDLDR